MLAALFWSPLLLIIYTYLGYPLILYVLSSFRNRQVQSDDNYHPTVTLIITVHNEEKRIENKIKNTLELSYPHEKLQVLFISDASTDETESIIKRYQSQGIGLVQSPERRGKEYAQRLAIEKAKGEILVFSDVATMLEPDGVQRIVANFADPSVGCVSSEDRLVDENGRISGEGAYVRYEMWLRSLETKVNSVVGLSGSFFAARKVVCNNWPTDIPSDFNTLLNSIRSGYRGISDPKSIGIYTNLKDEKREFERKVRTITRGINAVMANKSLLNYMRYGIFSWQLISHKLLRWLVPWLLTAALGSHLILAVRNRFYRLLLVPHLAFYMIGCLGTWSVRIPEILKIPYYFIHVNRAIAVAWVKYMRGERFITWTPSRR
jgi:glycosyltransferase involved in cell wall biosynthesis